MPGRSSPTRIARQPSAGFGSSGASCRAAPCPSRCRGCGTPPACRAPSRGCARRAPRARSASGTLVRTRNCSSVRNSPTPTAPHFGRLGRSAISPAFMCSCSVTPSRRRRRLVAQRRIGRLRLVQHLDLLAEGLGDGLLGAQVDVAVVAVDQDRVAVQRLAGDARRLDDQRDRQRPGDDRRVAADRALLEHHAAAACARSRAARPGRCCARRGSRRRGSSRPIGWSLPASSRSSRFDRSSRSCSRSRR